MSHADIDHNKMVYIQNINLTMVFWSLFRPRRALIVPNFVIGGMLLLLILVILCIMEGIRTDIQFSCRITGTETVGLVALLMYPT